MNGCEEAQMLISAALDEELTIDERLQLEAHLADCGDCRREEVAFEQVNRLLLPTNAESVAATVMRFDRRKSISDPRWISVAAAAALILLSLGAVLLRSPAASAKPMLGQLSEVYRINEHKKAAQDTMLQTLEWELRALRMELSTLETDTGNREQLAARLEALLDRVGETKQSDE